MQNTCIVIPCYNESERFPLRTFQNFIARKNINFCFVNDGSNDKTFCILQDLQKEFPDKVKTLDLPRNVGKAEAVRQGVMQACSTDEFEYIGFLDADLATPLEEIVYLFRYFNQNVDVIIGARVLRLGAVVERSTFRHYTGRIFATVANNLLDLKVYDSQCGAKIFRYSLAKQLFSLPFKSKWFFDLELLYRLKKAHNIDFQKNIIEVPLRTWQEKGSSKLKFRDYLFAPFELLRIKRATKKYNNSVQKLKL